MALAGLWENWRSPTGDWVRSFAIVATTPNDLCAELHNRMPVVLKPETWAVWLGEERADAFALHALLAPLPSDEMTCWPVSTRVGNVKNNDVSLIEPIKPNPALKLYSRATHKIPRIDRNIQTGTRLRLSVFGFQSLYTCEDNSRAFAGAVFSPVMRGAINVAT
jgi:hypothetical protein